MNAKIVKIVLVLVVLAVMLSACGQGYNYTNLPSDSECSAAGYDVTTPLVSGPNKLACINDAINDGILDGR
jgi:hypothetical protein